ncbi:hypothetical protein [Sphingorhabdus sp.]|uniref:hypothetical protein n=1 Tax=Sphingorhabdus sp. TaxID=1902408 RepID=UPI00391C652A
MSPDPVHLYYESAGNREYCLGFGHTETDRKILIVPPLFDEMNRTGRMIVEAMRDLARRGLFAYLLDLPGCNESNAPLTDQSITSWQLAVTEAAKQFGVTHIASIRGGCLLDDVGGIPKWRLAPVNGATLVKTLLRTRIAGDKEAGISTTAAQLLAEGQRRGVHLAGHHLSPQMLSELQTAVPVSTGLSTEDMLAELSGTPLWRRAEPTESVDMSLGIAARLDAWSATCGR